MIVSEDVSMRYETDAVGLFYMVFLNFFHMMLNVILLDLVSFCKEVDVMVMIVYWWYRCIAAQWVCTSHVG